MPEQNGKHAGHAENQGKRQKIPFLTEKIDVCIPKKFHAAFPLMRPAHTRGAHGSSGFRDEIKC
jgi:hypothetical protein